MKLKTGYQMQTEAHLALAEAIRLMVDSMGPKQRANVSRALAELSEDYDEKAARLLVNLALFVQPAR